MLWDHSWCARRKTSSAYISLIPQEFPTHFPLRCRAVNLKDREFVVGLFGSPNTFRTYNLLVNSHPLQSLGLSRLRENVTTPQDRWWWRLRRPNVLVGSDEDRKAVG